MLGLGRHTNIHGLYFTCMPSTYACQNRDKWPGCTHYVRTMMTDRHRRQSRQVYAARSAFTVCQIHEHEHCLSHTHKTAVTPFGVPERLLAQRQCRHHTRIIDPSRNFTVEIRWLTSAVGINGSQFVISAIRHDVNLIPLSVLNSQPTKNRTNVDCWLLQSFRSSFT